MTYEIRFQIFNITKPATVKPEMKTLAEIHSAQDEILVTLDDTTLSVQERILLQRAGSKLRDMETSIIHLVNEELINALKDDLSALKELTEQIDHAKDELTKVSAKIEDVSGKIASLVSALSTLLAAGLI